MGVKANDLRRGQAVEYKNGVWVCQDNTKIAKGKGQSYQSIQLKNIESGQLIEERFRTTEEFEPVHVDRKTMEYLYSDNTGIVVMDPETYEQVNIHTDLIGDQAVYLKENIALEIAFIGGNPITVELPNTVELVVEETPPQIKGATATNQYKDATCEGGALVKVPPFVENGELIKIDTRTGEYIGRA
ncbi:MAG: elongation factor P [Phycisphaerae bacterium]